MDTLDHKIQHIQTQLDVLEKALKRLEANSLSKNENGFQVTAPFYVVDNEGNQIIEIGVDLDGGHIIINNLLGKQYVTLGCTPTGGFVDISHSGSDCLAITLTTSDNCGKIEVTDKEGNLIFISDKDSN